MKRSILALVISAIFASVGCAHGQVQPNPTILTCPSSSGGFTPLNQSTPATGTNYTWVPPAGNWCVIAQSVLGQAVSVPSNTAGPVITTGGALVANWTAPTAGPAPSGYVLSEAPAISQTLGAPALNPTIASNTPPTRDGKPAPVVAKVAAPSGLMMAAK